MKKLVSALRICAVLMALDTGSVFAAWSFHIEGNNTASINLNFISDAGESFQTDAICLIINYTGGPFAGGSNQLLSGMTDLGFIEPSSGTVWASLAGDSRHIC